MNDEMQKWEEEQGETDEINKYDFKNTCNMNKNLKYVTSQNFAYVQTRVAN